MGAMNNSYYAMTLTQTRRPTELVGKGKLGEKERFELKPRGWMQLRPQAPKSCGLITHVAIQ